MKTAPLIIPKHFLKKQRNACPHGPLHYYSLLAISTKPCCMKLPALSSNNICMRKSYKSIWTSCSYPKN